MVSLTIFVIASGGVVLSLIRSSDLTRFNREQQLASDAAESILERIQGEEFSRIFASFNSNAADDPDGAGTAPGNLFTVTGLNLAPGDADGSQGQVIFPGSGAKLLEDADDPELSMPRDLNLDGAVDGADHVGDYQLLPVRVQIQWTGVSGVQQFEVVHLLTGM